MHTQIIYIPGLGGRYNSFRRFCLKFWRIYGASASLVPIDWYDGASFMQRMQQLKQVIETVDADNRIVLIGESAGATLALKAAALPRVDRVITLCGVAQPNTPISQYLRQKSPSLADATISIPDTTQYDVYSVYAAIDSVVGRNYSTARGAKPHRLWTFGHLTTIVLSLTFLSKLMVTIAKK